MKAVRVGVVGAGTMGQHHIRVLSTLPGAELAAIVDTHDDRRASYEENFRVPCFADYAALSVPLDAVTIAVPTRQHCRVAAHFLERNVHVLVEKPIAATLEESQHLIGLAHQHGVVLQVGHLERFNPAVVELLKHTRKPLYIEAHRLSYRSSRRHDVGTLTDLMIHDLDLLIQLVRSPVLDMSAVGLSVHTAYEDLARVTILFENGCIATLTASRMSGERLRTLRVVEANRTLTLDFIDQSVRLHTPRIGQPAHTEDLPVNKAEPLQLELEHFVHCVRTHQPPDVSGEDGHKALELALRAVNGMTLVRSATHDDCERVD